MTEIDNRYQENIELIENNFFEKFKKGKKREKIIEEYHLDLEKARIQYEREYNKKIEADRILANRKKKKKEEKENFKHLEIEHLDFEMSGKERFLSSLKLKFFKMDRFLKGNLSQKIPAKILYWDYKMIILIKSFFREVGRIKDNFIYITKKEFTLLINFFISISKKLVKLFSLSFKWIIENLKKIKKKKKVKNAPEKKEENVSVKEEEAN